MKSSTALVCQEPLPWKVSFELERASLGQPSLSPQWRDSRNCLAEGEEAGDPFSFQLWGRGTSNHDMGTVAITRHPKDAVPHGRDDDRLPL